MTNLLDETISCILSSDHTIDDIVYIGSEDYGCTWAEFEQLANVEYDSGFGAQEVATDLTIVFSDGQTMTRDEYDGSEGWNYIVPFKIPTEYKKIKRLVVTEDQVGWETLEGIHEDDEPTTL